jgi:Trypsin-like peptidase domain
MKKILLIISIFIFFAIAHNIQIVDAKVRSNEINAVGKIYIFTDDFNHDEYVSTGSGTIVDDDGYVLTNYHVIEDLLFNERWEAVYCYTYDETKMPNCSFALKLVAHNDSLDLALLKIAHVIQTDKSKVPFEQHKDDNQLFLPSAYIPEIYDSYGVEIGESITILGYPGTGGHYINYTKGAVSGFDSLYYEGEYLEWQIKTDADLDHGSSGGAAFDEWNNFIGVPTSVVTDANTVGYLISLPIINYFLASNEISLGASSGMCYDLSNGYFDSDQDTCLCYEGYDWSDSIKGCVEVPVQITSTELTDNVGDNSAVTDVSSNLMVNVDQTDDAFVNSEISKILKVDSQLVDRLVGRILLQVEDHGEAWYIDPTTKKRFYMKDGPTAYEMLRAFGLGIINTDLEKLKNGDKALLARLRGRIVLQVQEHGEAYYINPADDMVIYMKDGAEAYRLMRFYSLGITNNDLLHLPIKKFIPIN